MRLVPRACLPPLAATLLLLASSLAHAQYSWIDEKGVRQFSDRPPPPGTPAEKILKAPGHAATPAVATPASPAANWDSAPPGAYPNEKRDPRPLEVRQRAFLHEIAVMAAKPALKDTKAEQEQRCQKLHRYHDEMAKDLPWYKTGDDGKQRPMTKEERASQLGRIEQELASCPTP